MMIRLADLGLLRLLFACYLVCGGVSAQPAGVTISYSLVTPVVVLQEPVFLEFVIDNRSAAAIKADLGKYRKLSFSFDVTFPDGATIRDLTLPLREGIGAGGRISLSAGERYSQRLLLNEWVNFSEPGVYQVEATLTTPVEGQGGIHIPSPPFRAIVNVLQRDEAVLTRVCQSLVDRIERSVSVEEARDAAAALSYVVDPIAVPYLSAALRSDKYVSQEAAAGLERIGDMSATQVLISFLEESAGKEIGINTILGTKMIHVRQALAGIGRRSTDPAVRKTVQEALTSFAEREQGRP
jgi:hypothetical protein